MHVNVPVPLTSFVGRQREIAEVQALLSHSRLLTLTGPGGCGKTRLAIQVVADLVDRYQHGVYWVELAPVSDPALLARAVATALSIREVPGQPLTQSVAHHLASKHLLLVLDNCEQLLPGCAVLVETLLRACPHLEVVATSRESLGIGGETVWRVPPLAVPDAGFQEMLQALSSQPDLDCCHMLACCRPPGSPGG